MYENVETKNILREIGLQLDSNLYPRIYNGGIVKPGDTAIVSIVPGEDNHYVNKRSRRSTARSRNGATGWQRPSGGSWSTSSASPIIYSSLRETYEAEIAEVQEAYPGTKIWQQEGGMWLLTESTVLSGLGKKATFLTVIPYSKELVQKSWGFWTTAVSQEWIGPRHTNFPDGSVCAFDPRDRSWVIGDSIIKLLDIYTLWAFRHEHLRVFDRWPGFQSVPLPFERLSELKDDEYCGCKNEKNLFYVDCCKKHDLSITRIKSFIDFMRFTRGQINREPPNEICEFMSQREVPPAIDDIYC